MSDSAQISALLGRYEAAIRTKDAKAAVACFTDDFVFYDLAPPLVQEGGVPDERAYLQKWFDTWDGPINWVARDVTVKVGRDLGYAFTLRHVTGNKKDGTAADLWFRSTATFVKNSGEWKIAHLHNSVPFAMDGSNKALLELKP